MNNLEMLMRRDNTHPKDYERIAMWYIFAGNSDLYSKINYLYDFEDHSICPDAFESVDLSSGARALLVLAYNLYNGYSGQPADVKQIMVPLDEENRKLAIEAIKIRFNFQ